MTREDMTYYLVKSPKCLKLTGKYVLSIQIISKNIIYFKIIRNLHEVNNSGKGQFLVPDCALEVRHRRASK